MGIQRSGLLGLWPSSLLCGDARHVGPGPAAQGLGLQAMTTRVWTCVQIYPTLALGWASGGLGSRPCPFPGLSFFCVLGFIIAALLWSLGRGDRLRDK